MNKDIALVLQGFLALNDNEKKQFIEEIQGYTEYPYSTKDSIQKSITESFGLESNSISLGPSPNSCPCCGS
jgi:hypothetical protein